MLKKTQGVGPIRKVVLVKDDQEGLGISITVRCCLCLFSPMTLKKGEVFAHGPFFDHCDISELWR